MSEPSEVEIISRLLALAERYALEELEAEEGGVKVSLRARPAPSGEETVGGERYALWRPPMWAGVEAKPPPSTRPETAIPLLAPLTGTFYRAGAPDSPPFVEVGDTVEEGQPVALIEAMKVYSPIEADRSGVVVEVAASNGKLVHHGEVLLYIDPTLAT